MATLVLTPESDKVGIRGDTRKPQQAQWQQPQLPTAPVAARRRNIPQARAQKFLALSPVCVKMCPPFYCQHDSLNKTSSFSCGASEKKKSKTQPLCPFQLPAGEWGAAVYQLRKAVTADAQCTAVWSSSSLLVEELEKGKGEARGC